MRVLLLSASPKGEKSVSYQICLFCRQILGSDQASIELIGREPEYWKTHPDEFTRLIETIQKADALLIISPVYYHLLPSQVMGLLDLFKKEPGLLKGKPVWLWTTSIHYFDTTAHAWFVRRMLDMGALPEQGITLATYDLINPQKRDAVTQSLIFWASRCGLSPDTSNYPVKSPVSSDVYVLCLADDLSNEKVRRMIGELENSLPIPVKICDLAKVNIKSGCKGCVSCLFTGKCVINDGIAEVHSSLIENSKALIWCGEVADHFFSARYKSFLDRWMFRGHNPVLNGKAAGLLTPSPLDDEPEFREMFLSMSENMGARWAGFYTGTRSGKIVTYQTASEFAGSLYWLITSGTKLPNSFYWEAGHKIERDFVYSMKYSLFLDNDYYKKHHLYDFSNDNIFKNVWHSFIAILMHFRPVRELIRKMAMDIIIAPFRKIHPKNN